jgi:vacuolar iron transporter family protein
MSRDAKAASRFRGLLASERNSADLYGGLAGAATGERREVLTELAAVQRRHAAHRAAKLIELGEPVPPADRPGLRTTLLCWLARRGGCRGCGSSEVTAISSVEYDRWSGSAGRM